MPAYKYQTKAGKTKWYANFYYTDWLGEKKHKCKRGFVTKKEAQEWERSFLEKAAKTPSINFEDLYNNYMEDLSSRLKPTTLHNKRQIFNLKLLPFFGSMKICDITPAIIRQWQNEMVNFRYDNGKGYSQTHLRVMNGQLSAILNYAVKFYNLERNPCHSTEYIGKSKAGKMNIWTTEQFEYFIRNEAKQHYRLVYSILFYCGLREGEVLALTPADISENESMLHVNKTFIEVEGTEYFLTPKTETSQRDITMPQSLHDETLAYINDMKIGLHQQIFDIKKSTLIKHFYNQAIKLGLPRIRIHDLRHSHASMLIDMGRDIMEVSERLGHTSPQTTWNIYAHLYPGKEKELAEELDKVRLSHVKKDDGEKE